MATEQLLQAIAVTAELTGTQLSQGAARVLAEDLSRYPEQQVLAALTRCRREIRTRLTVADVVARIDDGRLGPEEAWAHVLPLLGDESASIVWTAEEKAAFFVCSNLEDDRIAARMAFLETYRKAVLESRNSGRPVKWEHCLGHNPAGREHVLTEAVRLGRLPAAHVQQLLPHLDIPDAMLKLIGSVEVLNLPEPA